MDTYLPGDKKYVLADVKNGLHEAGDLDSIFLLQPQLTRLMDAERITLFVCDTRTKELFSKMKSGDDIDEIRIPLDYSSIAAFAAIHQRVINIHDVYDDGELSTIDARLHFDRHWDQATGFRTRQVLVGPLVHAGKYLLGALQFINCAGEKSSFSHQDEFLLSEISGSMAMILFRHVSRNVTETMITDIFHRYDIDYAAGIEGTLDGLIQENRELKRRIAAIEGIIAE